MKLLIDTDIGDDIDDLLAIGVALKKSIDIVGVTTVFRDAVRRAEIVKGLLDYSGNCGIPVFSGCSKAIGGNEIKLGRFYYDGCPKSPVCNKEEDAIDFIIDCAKNYGSELTLLVIGAQTNVAKAYLKSPEIMRGIGKCVIMGGAFFGQYDEWNIACDPMAAKIVSESGMPIVYVPHDVTKEISLGQENYDYITKRNFTGVSKYVADGIKEWATRDGWCPLLHDPVALYYCIDANLFKEKKIHVKFIGDGELAGMTLNLEAFVGRTMKKDEYPLVTVVTEVRKEEIVEDFMRTLFLN